VVVRESVDAVVVDGERGRVLSRRRSRGPVEGLRTAALVVWLLRHGSPEEPPAVF